ncbi:uncharacterized protein LOC143675913 [Tamandua tetradactyla]|uniref:uncharacterized protein LOC143675913 n=1 Tax=Tamandua tetradactyla TaxID=48850 RepID=UPI004053A9E8
MPGPDQQQSPLRFQELPSGSCLLSVHLAKHVHRHPGAGGQRLVDLAELYPSKTARLHLRLCGEQLVADVAGNGHCQTGRCATPSTGVQEGPHSLLTRAHCPLDCPAGPQAPVALSPGAGEDEPTRHLSLSTDPKDPTQAPPLRSCWGLLEIAGSPCTSPCSLGLAATFPAPPGTLIGPSEQSPEIPSPSHQGGPSPQGVPGSRSCLCPLDLKAQREQSRGPLSQRAAALLLPPAGRSGGPQNGPRTFPGAAFRARGSSGSPCASLAPLCPGGLGTEPWRCFPRRRWRVPRSLAARAGILVCVASILVAALQLAGSALPWSYTQDPACAVPQQVHSSPQSSWTQRGPSAGLNAHPQALAPGGKLLHRRAQAPGHVSELPGRQQHLPEGHASLPRGSDSEDPDYTLDALPPAQLDPQFGVSPSGSLGAVRSSAQHAHAEHSAWSGEGAGHSLGQPLVTLLGRAQMQPRRRPGEARQPSAGTMSLLSRSPNSPGTSAQAPGLSCQPRTHLFFLKVHKAASSTVANLLFRFGEKHGLTFALPARQAPHFSYPQYFTASSVEGFSGGLSGQFDIMCQHLRFQPMEVQRVLPKDTFYFTILRDPARLMESAFSYYKGAAPFAGAWSLSHFLENTDTFYNPLQPDSHYARNLMAFDLGFDPHVRPTRQRLAQVVRAVAARFDLVLIAEHLDESLVLLRHALCWELDDVVAFPANRRAHWAREPLAPAAERRARAWNALDSALYVHFNRTLWARLHALGPARLRQEVAALRRRRAQLAHTCLPHGMPAAPGAVRDPQLAPLSHGLAPIVGYELRPGLDAATERACRLLATPELQFARRLYLRQFPDAAGGTAPDRGERCGRGGEYCPSTAPAVGGARLPAE